MQALGIGASVTQRTRKMMILFPAAALRRALLPDSAR